MVVRFWLFILLHQRTACLAHTNEAGMMKVLINPSWKCQLQCSYCLLKHIKINREAKEHSWQEWASGIIRHVPAGSIIDVAGGDPLLFPGLALFLRELAQHNLQWAITTNAMSDEGTIELIEIHPGNCVLVNISDHPGNIGADKNIERLRAAFPVVMNRVIHPDAGKRNVNISSLIPYQEYAEGTEQDHKLRRCNSGVDHWVIDPAMNVFLCNVAMATGRDPIGNLSGEIRRPKVPFECDWGCSSCYTSVPGAWICRQEEI
jgi:hypothetical protein